MFSGVLIIKFESVCSNSSPNPPRVSVTSEASERLVPSWDRRPRFLGQLQQKNNNRMPAPWRVASSLCLFRIVGRKFCPGQGLKPYSSEYGEAALDPEVIPGDLRGEVRLNGNFGIDLPSIRCLATSTSSTRLSLKLCCVGVLSGSPFPPRCILLKR